MNAVATPPARTAALPSEREPTRERAQARWAADPLRRRLAVVRRFRHALADAAATLTGTLTDANPSRADDAQTLAAEIVPLASAAAFLEREAGRLLAPRALGRRGRPAWLPGVTAEVRREPWGTVLVVAPGNYPLLLPGVQTLQALTAGNAVILKPGRNGTVAAQALARLLGAAGLPEGLLTVTEASDRAATAAVEAGVDHVVLTGSSAAGRAVLARCAERLVPATLELSGSDAVWVGPRADLAMVVRLLVYGARLNGGATCLGPVRVFVHDSRAAALEEALRQALTDAGPVRVDRGVSARLSERARQAVSAGARLLCGGTVGDGAVVPWLVADARPDMAVMREDLFGPLLTLTAVASEEAFLALNARCPYRLGAAVFDGSEGLIAGLPVGSVTVGDVIVPTADPRLPFGGRGESGFGVTRGREGLVAMTRPKVVTRRRGGFRPHADHAWSGDPGPFLDYLQAAHGSRPGKRLAATARLLRAVAGRGRP